MNDVSHKGFAPEVPARFTIEQFQRLVDSGVLDNGDRLELEDGYIVRMSPASSSHMYFRQQLLFGLHDIYKSANLGWIVVPELSMKLGDATLRDADIGVVRPFGPGRDYVDPATILLAVEVSVSSVDYDLTRKARDYAQAGISHYWVVDVEDRRIHLMWTPLGDGYAERRLHAFGDPLPVPETDRSITIG